MFICECNGHRGAKLRDVRSSQKVREGECPTTSIELRSRNMRVCCAKRERIDNMSVNIGSDINSMYDAFDSAAADNLKTNLTNRDLKNATDAELMDACKQFESYLVEQMFKAMEKTVMKDEDEESDSYISGYTDYFDDMKVQKYAQVVTDNGELGIAQKLYDQLKLNLSETIPQAGEVQAAENVNPVVQD